MIIGESDVPNRERECPSELERAPHFANSARARARTFAHVCMARECGQRGEKPRPFVATHIIANLKGKREGEKQRGRGEKWKKKRKGICGVHLKHLPEYFRRPMSDPEISPDTDAIDDRTGWNDNATRDET